MAYAVAGWALSQGIAQVFPVFDIPNWAIRSIVLLIIVGFPIAIVFAWFFESTPEGIKRTEVADALRASIHAGQDFWIYVVVIGSNRYRSACFLRVATVQQHNDLAASAPSRAGVHYRPSQSRYYRSKI